MAIIKWSPMTPWDPFEDMERAFDGLRTMRGVNAFAPAMDVYQTDDNVIAEVSLPGIDPQNVEVSVADDVLTVEGKSESKTEVDEKNYYRREVRSGSFHRSVALPAAVNGDKATAVYEDGILKISIPKEARTKPKSIKVEVKKK